MKDDIVHTNPDKVATIFNTFFTNVAKEIGNGCSNYTNVNDRPNVSIKILCNQVKTPKLILVSIRSMLLQLNYALTN